MEKSSLSAGFLVWFTWLALAVTVQTVDASAVLLPVQHSGGSRQLVLPKRAPALFRNKNLARKTMLEMHYRDLLESSPDGVAGNTENIFWEFYKGRAVAVLALCGVEALVIVFLLFRHARYAEVNQLARESEERFRLMANTAPMLVWMSGADRLYTYVNKAWLDFTGRTMELELGNGWTEGIYPDDLQKCLEMYKDAFDRREEFRLEYRLRRYDAEYRWVLNIGVPRFSQDHSFVGYIGSCIDVTDLRQAEGERIKLLEEITHLNRVASMGQMAASLVHELVQPLAAILSNAQAAVRFASRPEPDLQEIQGALSDIAEDDQRARAFVNNMRSMFQKQTITRTSLDLNRIVYDVSRLVRNDALRRGIQIRVAMSLEAIPISGDAVALQQVILNLVSNGMDALQNKPSGQKTLTLTTLARKEPGYGTIMVEDNGCGIAEENKSKLFTPFFTTKNDGLGMGLSICRSLIESLDGRITLLDRDESGAAFQVDLPIVVEASLRYPSDPQLENRSLMHS